MNRATLVASALVTAAALRAGPAFGDVPVILNQQGRLLDSQDRPLNAMVDLTFTLYNDSLHSDAANVVWTRKVAQVPVVNGIYSVPLGADGSLTTPMLTAGTLWLGLQVNADGEMSPRLQLGSVPYALAALELQCAGCVTKAQLGAGAALGNLDDGSVPLAKLAGYDADKKQIAGLDAATLNGLDASAFAPSSIEAGVSAIATSVGTGLGAAVAANGTAIGNVATSVTANGSAIANLASAQTSAGSAIAGVASGVTSANAALTGLAAAVGTPSATTLAADTAATRGQVATLVTAGAANATAVAALAAAVGTPASGRTLAATLAAAHRYSQACDPTADTFLRDAYPGLADAPVKTACLQDGRWHLVGSALDTWLGAKASVPFGMEVAISMYGGRPIPATFNTWNGGSRYCGTFQAVGDVDSVSAASSGLVVECITVGGTGNKLFTVTQNIVGGTTSFTSQRNYATWTASGGESGLPCSANGGWTSCGDSESLASAWQLWARQ